MSDTEVTVFPSNVFGAGNYLKAEDQFFQKEVALAPSVAFTNVQIVGKTQGGLVLVVEAVEDCLFTIGKKATISLSTSATETGTYDVYKQTMTMTAIAETTFKAGKPIMEVLLPNLPNLYLKATLTTDSGLTKKVSCYLRYMAR